MFGDNYIDKNMTKNLCKKWFLIKCYPSMLKSLLNDDISGKSVKVHVQIEAFHIETEGTLSSLLTPISGIEGIPDKNSSLPSIFF